MNTEVILISIISPQNLALNNLKSMSKALIEAKNYELVRLKAWGVMLKITILDNYLLNHGIFL